MKILTKLIAVILLVAIVLSTCSCSLQTILAEVNNDETVQERSIKNISLLNSVELNEDELETENDDIPR
ncbi:MAG: hypothetical protein IKA02_03140, partial [Clostridia bacterium]|nr:hypothetical protein [Clostridia bacterium]